MKEYKKKLTLLEKEKNKQDWEVYHIIRDEILEDFVVDISLNKFKKNEIVSIAKLLKEKIIDEAYKEEVYLWFA